MKRFLIIVATSLVLVTIVAVTGFLSLGFWLSPQSPLEKSDAIVAISGGETTSRTEEAIKLYRAGWAPRLVFSGAASDPASPSNAAAMRIIAISQGVDPAVITLDEAAANTAQNAADVGAITKTSGWHKIILVTSPYHQRRAAITFGHELGPSVKIINHSATDQNWRRSAWWANNYSYRVTLSELQKTLYVIFNH